MNNEEKEAIEQLKSWREYIINHRDSVNKANDIEFYLRTALNLIEKQQKEIEDLKENNTAISKASYMAGVLDERGQWYKKINEKYNELTQEEKETDGIVMNTKEKKILKELIGKEE